MAKPSPTDWMLRSCEVSRRGVPAPNPHVGCVIVREGNLVGEGFHAFAGGDHAEVMALKEAGESAQGATAYVTLEPCNHFGSTPPCSHALVNAGVSKVVYACADPNPKAAGGAEFLRQAGVEVESGLCEQEAQHANEVWWRSFELGRPFVTLHIAVSADGFVDDASGRGARITGQEAIRDVQQSRGTHGCVLIGRNTAAGDNPRLTVREFEILRQPLRVILDSRAQLQRNLNVFSDGLAPTLRIVERGMASTEFDLECDSLANLLQELRHRDVKGVYVEGGPETLRRFARAGFVDRFDVYQSPKPLGTGKSFDPNEVIELANLVESERRALGEDVLIRYRPGSK
ncbi:MAG: bifunctional diaminohydroxyphosphoribosylaminopyrimidine deaminase/5-amino-6-(5-phosphoribosylamino)uracil reductase RibD [Armatimonadetes bacterium]|nr:bifunctional diaminohydroxyphosphoribosylaminopyrimidine deaminase/5-amino-6-(5-phosphoribosylamino)uracil reductase RibD [Armatimonadota bacterium]